MGETNTSRMIFLAIGTECPETTIFRNNTGMAWTGEIAHQDAGCIILKNPRPLHAGLTKGSSDSIGWTEVQITPDMVGKKVAVFTAIEIKQPKGKAPSTEQENFIEQVRRAGGIAGVARTPENAVSIIKNK